MKAITLIEAEKEATATIGGKGLSLSKLLNQGYKIPSGVILPVSWYNDFIEKTGIRSWLQLELSKKPIAEMRWEEIWDLALRIEHVFLKTHLPEQIKEEIIIAIDQFEEKGVVVRSSSPLEDSHIASFAGIHKSFVNVHGKAYIIESIKQVWASLWTDRSLMYRRELSLDPFTSSMSVIIQEFVEGEFSGVAFSRSPKNQNQLLIEAVPGLNEGLVSGLVAPDRIYFDRASQELLRVEPGEREAILQAATSGTSVKSIGKTLQLDKKQMQQVFDLSMEIEKLNQVPQDIEWTFLGDQLFLLQARPITTGPDLKKNKLWQEDDKRHWYLTLTPDFENLKQIEDRITKEYLPAIKKEAETMIQQELSEFSQQELENELERREQLFDHWETIYWEYFIPFAHGFRLFGEIYNKAVVPQSSFEFIELLESSEIESIKRNQLLEDLANIVRSNPTLQSLLKKGYYQDAPEDFKTKIEQFLTIYGLSSFGGKKLKLNPVTISELVVKMQEIPAQINRKKKANESKRLALKKKFLKTMEASGRADGMEILRLGRSSYRLRDDDNLVLAKISAEVDRVKELLQGENELVENNTVSEQVVSEEMSAAGSEIVGVQTIKKQTVNFEDHDRVFKLKTRQLIGTSAVLGIATGRARVIETQEDAFAFEPGEIIVCDAIDPNITFIVPMAKGIVERRGGMLIHGAIVAREYGIPCVTGVKNASQFIQTGNNITVDGHLGVVIVRA